VEGVEDFLITTHDGHQVRATRAISDKEHDVAFIWVDDLRCTDDEHFARYPCGKVMEPEHEVKLHPLPIGPIKDCRLGQNVYVIGSPYG
jgi:S1-C subfamily serine protease